MEEAKRQELTGPGFRAFLKIAAIWKLTAEEQQALLGGVDGPTFQHWKQGQDPSLDEDQLERVSHILSVYKSLQILLPPDNADGWVRRSNAHPLFGGQTALDLLITGGAASFRQVRFYLESQVKDLGDQKAHLGTSS